MILSSKDRVVGVQGYAGTVKTRNAGSGALSRGEERLAYGRPGALGLGGGDARERGRHPEARPCSASLARNAGVAEGRLMPGAERRMRASFRKTVLVVDEGSLASTVQARNLLRIADRLRIPRVVLVGDEKQLNAVDAGKPFTQLQQAGMKTVVMDEILRQRDPALKEAVRASLAGDVRAAFEKLGESVAEVKADNLAGAAAARWLRLSPEERENTGLMAPSPCDEADRPTATSASVSRPARVSSMDRHLRTSVWSRAAIPPPRRCRRRTTHRAMSWPSIVPTGALAWRRAMSAGCLGPARTASSCWEGANGQAIPWRPRQVGALRGAVEVYRVEPMELRAGDRIRWTRNDADLQADEQPCRGSDGGAGRPGIVPAGGSAAGWTSAATTRNCGMSTTPGRPRCMPFRVARSIT